MKKAKRAYSHEFPFTETAKRYLLDSIPAGLWRRVQAKAKREGVSVRVIILRFLTSWVEAP